MTVKIRRERPTTTVPIGKFAGGSGKQAISIRSFRLGEGLPTVSQMREELDEYTDVLMGRLSPPIENGEMTLLEYANAVYSRAQELTILLQRAESNGTVVKGSKPYKFRTGELRTFVEMANKAIELGSRRVTAAKLEYEMTLG